MSDYTVKDAAKDTGVSVKEARAAWGKAEEDSKRDRKGDGGGGGGCFIATAIYQDPLDFHVETLRNFRDSFLMKRTWGKRFVKTYYRASPPIARFISRYQILRKILKPVFSRIISHFFL